MTEVEETWWNHRVVYGSPDEGGDPRYLIAEVHYEDGKPFGWTEAFLCEDTVEQLHETVQRMLRAFNLPTLTVPGDFEHD